MRDILQYGFLIPPHGEIVNLTDSRISLGLDHMDYCKKYIESIATHEERSTYENFLASYWNSRLSPSGCSYTDFCIQVLNWCKVGNLYPQKIITFTGEAFWHSDIYDEYSSYGFKFDYVPSIKLWVINK